MFLIDIVGADAPMDSTRLALLFCPGNFYLHTRNRIGDGITFFIDIVGADAPMESKETSSLLQTIS